MANMKKSLRNLPIGIKRRRKLTSSVDTESDISYSTDLSSNFSFKIQDHSKVQRKQVNPRNTKIWNQENKKLNSKIPKSSFKLGWKEKARHSASQINPPMKNSTILMPHVEFLVFKIFGQTGGCLKRASVSKNGWERKGSNPYLTCMHIFYPWWSQPWYEPNVETGIYFLNSCTYCASDPSSSKNTPQNLEGEVPHSTMKSHKFTSGIKGLNTCLETYSQDLGLQKASGHPSLKRKLVQLPSVDMQKAQQSFWCYSHLSPRVTQPSCDAQSLCRCCAEAEDNPPVRETPGKSWRGLQDHNSRLHSDCAKTSKYSNRWSLDGSFAGCWTLHKPLVLDEPKEEKSQANLFCSGSTSTYVKSRADTHSFLNSKGRKQPNVIWPKARCAYGRILSFFLPPFLGQHPPSQKKKQIRRMRDKSLLPNPILYKSHMAITQVLENLKKDQDKITRSLENQSDCHLKENESGIMEVIRAINLPIGNTWGEYGPVHSIPSYTDGDLTLLGQKTDASQQFPPSPSIGNKVGMRIRSVSCVGRRIRSDSFPQQLETMHDNAKKLTLMCQNYNLSTLSFSLSYPLPHPHTHNLYSFLQSNVPIPLPVPVPVPTFPSSCTFPVLFLSPVTVVPCSFHFSCPVYCLGLLCPVYCLGPLWTLKVLYFTSFTSKSPTEILKKCLQLTCSMLQPSCYPNSNCFNMSLFWHSHCAECTSNNRSFLGLSACQLQAVDQVFFVVPLV
ncbi:hypothetical protein VP01_3853g1 [Puccinia sorghi]|uniref:Uncharacterized protein n=1 Tax=Puccinia sorghi TaxID=27349 RepID=A0A0L6UT25_9BASI|nr:hypothetical protein VP01_3853g1 [Puccinia sorghi]